MNVERWTHVYVNSSYSRLDCQKILRHNWNKIRETAALAIYERKDVVGCATTGAEKTQSLLLDTSPDDPGRWKGQNEQHALCGPPLNLLGKQNVKVLKEACHCNQQGNCKSNDIQGKSCWSLIWIQDRDLGYWKRKVSHRGDQSGDFNQKWQHWQGHGGIDEEEAAIHRDSD